ncbi:MAG: hypothetical protein ACTSWQ_09835 [Candidatus Thorarchaeota archaeon]
MGRVIQDIQSARKYKNSSTAVFLGSGSSINDITDKQWAKLREFDLWTVNNWVYHPTVVPRFYHLELKSYGFPIVSRRFEEKKDKYKDVKFIVPEGKSLTLTNGAKVRTLDAIPSCCEVFTYSWVNNKTREKKNINASYQMRDDVVTRSYGVSITSVLELMYKFGYERIVLYGVDLNNSLYFWTGGDPKYGKVHHQTNKAHENRSPKSPHSTSRIVTFITDFNSRWMVPKGGSIYVGTKKSMLYSDLNYISIGDL